MLYCKQCGSRMNEGCDHCSVCGYSPVKASYVVDQKTNQYVFDKKVSDESKRPDYTLSRCKKGAKLFLILKIIFLNISLLFFLGVIKPNLEEISMGLDISSTMITIIFFILYLISFIILVSCIKTINNSRYTHKLSLLFKLFVLFFCTFVGGVLLIADSN